MSYGLIIAYLLLGFIVIFASQFVTNKEEPLRNKLRVATIGALITLIWGTFWEGL